MLCSIIHTDTIYTGYEVLLRKKEKKNVSLNYSFAIIHSISRENNIILTISYLKRGGRVERKSNVKAEIFFLGQNVFLGQWLKC